MLLHGLLLLLLLLLEKVFNARLGESDFKTCGAARFCSARCISVPMCDHSTACNPHRHIRRRLSTIKRGIGLHLILYSIHNTVTDRRCARSQSKNTPPVKKLAPLTTRSSSLRCVSEAEHHTAEQYSKTGRTKPRKHLPRSSLSWNTCQDFLKIKSR